MSDSSQLGTSSELQQQTRHLIVQFLEIEVDTSLTFAEAAFSAEGGSSRRNRNEKAANRGYETICHFLDKDSTLMVQSKDFRRKVIKLRIVLAALTRTRR